MPPDVAVFVALTEAAEHMTRAVFDIAIPAILAYAVWWLRTKWNDMLRAIAERRGHGGTP